METCFAVPQLLVRARCTCRPNRLTRTIVYLTVLARLRVAEIVRLRWRDVDFERRVIRVRGKSGIRIVPLDPEVGRALALWREHLLEAAAARGNARISPFVLGSLRSGEPVPRSFVAAVLAIEARHVRLPQRAHAVRRATAERRMRQHAPRRRGC